MVIEYYFTSVFDCNKSPVASDWNGIGGGAEEGPIDDDDGERSYRNFKRKNLFSFSL
jgi:hypothetical protein